MANELVHASAGTILTQSEFEAIGLHVLNSQATGDLIYASSATQLSRLGIGTNLYFLKVVGGVPAWSNTLDSPIINGTVTTTGLTLPLFTPNAELEAYLLKDGKLLLIPTQAGWTEVLVTSGSTISAVTFQKIRAGNTANASALLSVALNGLAGGVTNYTFKNWDKKLYLFFDYARQYDAPAATARIQLKEVDTIGALGAKGIGLKVLNFALWGESYGTELGEVDLATSLTSLLDKAIFIVHDPACPR